MMMICVRIFILQASVAAHLRCGGIFNRVIANCIQNVQVKEF